MNALKRAAEILREDALGIRESHTLGGDWQSEDKAKADHDEMMAVAEQLVALQSQTAPAVPEGWRLVPVEPTGEMQVSGAKAIRFNTTGINKLWTGGRVYDAMLAAAPQPDHSPDAGMVVPFQSRVNGWMQECFGPEISADKVERNHRFLEEALELVQALGSTKDEAHKLVDYVYGRAVGDPPQEVGGVMVTLAALCLANGMDMDAAAETELSRILQPEVVTKIREKQKRKPAFSPLPGSYPDRAPAADGGEVEPAFWITKNDFERASNKTNLLCSVTVRGEWDGLVPLYTHPAQPRNVVDAVTQFKDELVKSVKPILRPHIEGVCAVVLDRLRSNRGELMNKPEHLQP